MYCRQCHYDLRSLTINRCPECGEAFDPTISDTFYQEFPSVGWHLRTALRSFRESCIRNRGQIVFILLLLWGLGILGLLPAFLGTNHNLGLRRSNLTGIMTTWAIQLNEPARTSLAFDKDAARLDMQPSFSSWTEQKQITRRGRIENQARMAPFLFAPLAGLLLIISLLWRGRVRRIVRVLVVLCLLTSLTAIAPKWISEMLVPGTYNFLDDYVCLENVDLRHPKGDIAAYAWRTFIGEGRRMIAFDDGHIEAVEHDRARQLFEQQGIPYPSPREP